MTKQFLLASCIIAMLASCSSKNTTSTTSVTKDSVPLPKDTTPEKIEETKTDPITHWDKPLSIKQRSGEFNLNDKGDTANVMFYDNEEMAHIQYNYNDKLQLVKAVNTHGEYDMEMMYNESFFTYKPNGEVDNVVIKYYNNIESLKAGKTGNVMGDIDTLKGNEAKKYIVSSNRLPSLPDLDKCVTVKKDEQGRPEFVYTGKMTKGLKESLIWETYRIRYYYTDHSQIQFVENEYAYDENYWNDEATSKHIVKQKQTYMLTTEYLVK